VAHRPGEFPDTRWTLIASSRASPAARRAALDELLGAYWRPLYLYARRKGRDREASQDAVQGFIAHLLEREFLARLDPARGRFRSFLRTAFDHFLANEHERESAAKRGGGLRPVALDFDVAESALCAQVETPESAYDREWALGVMERAQARLKEEFDSGVRSGPFDTVARFFRFDGSPSHADAARDAGMTPQQFKAFLHRARVRFRDLVRQDVAHTVSTPEETELEMAELIRALST
jgi:RNA polymerase sigma-70 factor (ECF subfamily)